MKQHFLKHLFAAFLVLIVVPVSGSKADWVNLTGAEVAPNIAEIYVDETGVRIGLEIFVGDLDLFSDLVPDAWYKDPARIKGSEGDRLRTFGSSVLRVEADGALLPVELRKIEQSFRKERASPYAGTIDPYSGRRFPAPPEDKRVIFAELVYPFEDGPPKSVTFSPPQSEDGRTAASIGMIVFHDEVPVIDFRYLSSPVVLNLDWKDPWFSRFENTALTRHHRYPRMSFLYAEPYEIRHEALIRVRDAADLVGLSPKGSKLSAEEAAELMDRAGSFLAERSPMTVDGKTVVPDFDRAAYMRIGLRGLEILSPGEPVDVDAAILGLIWSAPTDGLPKKASVEWTLYDQEAREVPGYAIDAAGPFLATLTKEDPVLVWTNHFKKSPVPAIEQVEARPWAEVKMPAASALLWLGAVPLFALAFRRRSTRQRLLSAGAAALLAVAGILAVPVAQISVPRPGVLPAEMAEEQAQALSEQLLSNVYRSFDFRGEEQVYDRLEKTLDGRLLEDVYLDQRQALRMARAGGADARVKQVSVASATPEHIDGTAADFSIRTKWTIVGTVGHWGHTHQRVNSYEADLIISPENGSWKIIGFDVLNQERLS